MKLKQTFLDKLVSFVNPQAGVQRLMAKKALTKFEYDAVKYTRERRGPSNLSGAEDFRSNYDRVELMKRARDLAENNGLVRSILMKFASHVASNLTYQARTDNPKANTEIEAYWNEWFANCDLSTRHTGSTLMQVATMSMLRDGDFLFVLVRDKNGDLKLQGIESDRLGDPYKTYTSLELIGGIHIDRDTGAPTAYDIYNRSIGDFYSYQVTISASQAFHYFDPLRIDQYRGVSAFHTAINDATDIYDIVNFEKLAAKVASSQSAVVKRSNNNASDLSALTTEENFDNQQIKLESMESGKVSYLEPGEDIIFPDGPSRPSGAFAEFHKILLRNICMGLGIPYSFAVDPSAMSGPTARLEMQQAGRTFNRYQKLLNDKVLNPIKNIVIADGVARGMISGNGAKTTKGIFNFGANVSIDLGRESMANIAEFKAGLTTASSIYAEKGLDVEAAFRARAIETKMIQDLAKEYGVPAQAVSEILLPTGQPAQQAQPGQTTQDGQQVEGQEDVIGQSLNGAQVASLINVINAVAAGALSKEGAVSVITAAFPTISREQAIGIVAGVQSGKIIPTTEKEKQAAQDGQQDEGQGGAPVPATPKAPVAPTGLEELKCPLPTQDVKLNLENRQTAVDKANYGPANPNEPNESYWKAKANEFQGDVGTAKKMLCGNCAAFNQTSGLLGCIKNGIGEDANEVALGGNLGYCEIFDFKCAAKRTCDAWIVGGPMTDKKKQAEQALSSLSQQELKMLIAGMMGGIELGKYDGIDFTPPEGARESAKRALDVREEKPASQKGMTPVGIARARDLINGVKFSPDTVRRMKAFFDRHEVDKKGETWDEQGKGWQAWNGWGGDAGYSWAKKVVGQMESRDNKQLARPISQTPAPPKERIKGSKENPKGTASTRSKSGGIEISDENEEALKNKIAEFKDKHPTRKAPSLGALKKVFRRGAGAFSTSFRPTITGGKPNSRNAWAMARVNKFLKMAGGGEVKKSYRQADGDLLEEGLNGESSKTEFKAGDGLNPCGMRDDGTFDDENSCSNGYGRPKLVGGYTPKRPGGKIPPKPTKPTPAKPTPTGTKPKPPLPPPPPPPPGTKKPTDKKPAIESKFPNATKAYDSREKASIESAIKGNQKELDSVREAVIKKSEDVQKEIDSAKNSIVESKKQLEELRAKARPLRDEAVKYREAEDVKNYLETRKTLDAEYAKINKLEEGIEEQEKKIKTANEKARQIGFAELKKDMLAVNKQDGFSSEQLAKATQELKEKQQSAIATDRKSIKDASIDYVKERREKLQGELREIFNPHIHSESLSRPITYWNEKRADSTATIVEFVDGTRSSVAIPSTSGGIRVRISTEPKTYAHEYGHQIEDGNAEAKDLCKEFLDKRTAGEKIQKFQKTMPGYRYKRYEKGSADNFGKAHAELFPEFDTNNRAYYTGKRYDDTPFGKTSKYIGATEVYSMGMELLHKNPAKFAQVDPEWFDLVSGIATGRLLKKTRGVE
jgi:lambda family phage portal protein